MVVENTVIGGLAFASFMFAYLGFELRENETVFNQLVSLLFFSMSLLFINFVVYGIMLIVQNNSSLSYLSDPITYVAFNIVMWITIIVFFFYFLFMLLKFLSFLFEMIMGYLKNKRNS